MRRTAFLSLLMLLACERAQATARTPPTRLKTNASCIGCHETEARQWAGSLHNRSWTGASFAHAYDNEPSPFCWECHAPESTADAQPRGQAARVGVTCVSCHVDPAAAGMRPAPDHPALVRRDASSTQACGRCHEFGFESTPSLAMQSTSVDLEPPGKDDAKPGQPPTAQPVVVGWAKPGPTQRRCGATQPRGAGSTQTGQPRGGACQVRHVLAGSPGFAWARYNKACAWSRMDQTRKSAALMDVLLHENLPRFRPRFLADEDLGALRASPEGTKLQASLPKTAEVYGQVLARGVKAFVFEPRAQWGGRRSGRRPRRPADPLHAGCASRLYDHETNRFVPMVPARRKVYSGSMLSPRQEAYDGFEGWVGDADTIDGAHHRVSYAPTAHDFRRRGGKRKKSGCTHGDVPEQPGHRDCVGGVGSGRHTRPRRGRQHHPRPERGDRPAR